MVLFIGPKPWYACVHNSDGDDDNDSVDDDIYDEEDEIGSDRPSFDAADGVDDVDDW